MKHKYEVTTTLSVIETSFCEGFNSRADARDGLLRQVHDAASCLAPAPITPATLTPASPPSVAELRGEREAAWQRVVELDRLIADAEDAWKRDIGASA